MNWLTALKELVEKRPIIILNLKQEWKQLSESRRGVHEFTITRPHAQVENVKAPSPCLITGGDHESTEFLSFGLIGSRAAVSTLDSRIKVRRAARIEPRTPAGLLQLVSQTVHRTNLRHKLRDSASVAVLTPKLSSHLIEKLATIEGNRGVMRSIAESLSSPKYFRSMAAFQEDAVQIALKAFGLAPGESAKSVELVEGLETALARIGVIEDAVVEHDARQVPDYDLVGSDITGRATFKKDRERLEVYTANRRPLEQVFGVDLIYLNLTRQNIVMVQYKMLEPAEEKSTEQTDWIYRPDAKFDEEVARMRRFSTEHPPGPHEYRLNSDVFYIKFVKRDGSLKNGGIVLPLKHYEVLREDPSCRGPRNGFRISYESLSGRYLRANAFVNLLHSGYIGAHADTTQRLKMQIEGVINNGRAVVAALQRPATALEIEEDNAPKEEVEQTFEMAPGQKEFAANEVIDFEDLL